MILPKKEEKVCLDLSRNLENECRYEILGHQFNKKIEFLLHAFHLLLAGKKLKLN